MQRRWLSLLAFVLFANLFWMHEFGAMAGSLLMLGLTGLEVATLGNARNRSWAASALGVSAVLAGANLYVSSPEKYGLIIVAFLANLIVSGYSMLKTGWVSGLLELVATPLLMGWAYIRSGIRLLVELIGGNWEKLFGETAKHKSKSSWFKSGVLGLLLGLPLTIWLIATLSQADPIFATYTKAFLTQDFWNNWMPRVIFSLVILFLVSPLILMQIGKYISPLWYVRKVSWSREVIVVTAMVTLVLGSFLVIQWPYVFAHVAQETDLARFGVATYSEYVQRGFWDLLKVVVMVFAVAWAGLILGKGSKGKTRKIFLSLQAVLGVEFVVFVVSICRRVWLYQSYHGLSLARLYGMVILIWILGMVATMVMRYVTTKISWVRVELAWAALVILLTLGLNLEKWVVHNPPTVNGHVDYVYLSRLPGDGYDGWIEAYEWIRQTQLKASAQSGILSHDMQRELYYAWYATANLARHYDDLIHGYGSKAELKEYYRAITQAKRDTLEFNKLSTSEKKQIDDTLGKVMVRLDGNDWERQIYLYPAHNQMVYRDLLRGGGSFDSGLYVISDGNVQKVPTRLDTILQWSMAGSKQYEMIKRDIGVQGILDLQKQNMLLIKRVVEQPADSRGFEVDLSFDSPFVD